MSTVPVSTIAELLFDEPLPFNFARLVGDLDAVLSRFPGSNRVLTWDCEDVAIFDLPGTRILLGCCDQLRSNAAGCLTLSVGPSHQDLPPGQSPILHDALCLRLVERVRDRLAPASIQWHEYGGIVTSDVLDDLMTAFAEAGPANQPLAEPAEEVAAVAPVETVRPIRATARGAAPRADAATDHQPANDRPDIPRSNQAELARLRAALYAPEDQVEAGPSVQMRLASHAVNATLILVWAPLGAAAMTYGILKGEDMRLSARLMAITGTLVGLSQTPLGHSMAAIAGV